LVQSPLVAIRASSSKQIDTLIAALSSDSAVKRETAIARLAVIGARAIDRVTAVAQSNGPSAVRVAAFRTLEAIADAHALEPALAALNDGDADVAVAAAAVARVFVRSERGTAAVDRLTGVAVDRSRPDMVRLAAFGALVAELGPSTLAPLIASLADDPSEVIRGAARSGVQPVASPSISELLTAAADRGVLDDPDTLRHAIGRAGPAATLEQLRQIVERVREREGAEPAPRREAWMLVRAAAHVALAARGSRIAVYDLRESLESAKKPLPVEFLKAVTLVGDASLLEAIASAHARAKDAWWRQHLTDAFFAIITRERITARSPVLKKISKRFPSLLT
jgi:HEAT repeat protein